MVFIIKSLHTNLITKENIPHSDWEEKVDNLERIEAFKSHDELINQLKIELNLDEVEVLKIKDCFNKNSNAKFFRYFGVNKDNFKIEPTGFNFNHFKGKLIYWKDWDYLFYQSDSNFILQVYIGGMSDTWQKMKLNKVQIEEYIRNGTSKIDYLVNDLRNWRSSLEYDKAVKENRIIN